MSGLQAVEIREDGLRDVIAHLIVDLVRRDEHCHDGDRRDLLVEASVRAGRDRRLRVERVLRDQGLGLVGIDRQQADLVLRGDILYGRGRIAGRQESCIDVAVLEGAGAFGEGQVLDVDVIVGDAVRFEDLAGIRLSAGAGCTDGDALALELIDALDARLIKRDELAGLRIERGDAADVVDFLVLEHLRAIDGVVRDIVLHDGQVDGVILEHVDVRDRRTSRLRTRIHARDLLIEDLRHRTANRVVRASRTARRDIEEFLLAALTAASG